MRLIPATLVGAFALLASLPAPAAKLDGESSATEFDRVPQVDPNGTPAR
jgi:hypothetical protein